MDSTYHGRENLGVVGPIYFFDRSGNSGVFELIYWSDAIGYPWPENVSKATKAICCDVLEVLRKYLVRCKPLRFIRSTIPYYQHRPVPWLHAPLLQLRKWPGCVVFVHNPTIKLSSGGDFSIFFHLHFTFFILPLLSLFL